MKRLRVFPFLFLALSLSSMSAPAAGSHDFVDQQRVMSHLIVNLFLEQLVDNDIALFGHTIGREELIPKQVSFAYQLGKDGLSVDIYNDLVNPLPVPKGENLYLKGITVTVDDKGMILQIKGHLVTY